MVDFSIRQIDRVKEVGDSEEEELESGLVLACDGCTETHSIDDVEPEHIPEGWKPFNVDGWVGTFHACSELCYHRVKRRYSRKPGEELIVRYNQKNPFQEEKGPYEG